VRCGGRPDWIQTIDGSKADLARTRLRANEMDDSMKAYVLGFAAIALWLIPKTGFAAENGEAKKVTRVEIVIAEKNGQKMVVNVHGMAPTSSSLFGNTGELVRRDPENKPNNDGLIEYNLCFVPPEKETKTTKLRAVRASITESSISSEVKGVRIFAEYNEMNGMFAEAKKNKKDWKQQQQQAQIKQPKEKDR
jgi:hypothetical protein